MTKAALMLIALHSLQFKDNYFNWGFRHKSGAPVYPLVWVGPKVGSLLPKTPE